MVESAKQKKPYKLKCWKFLTMGNKKYGIHKVSKPMNTLESREEEIIAEVNSTRVYMEGFCHKEHGNNIGEILMDPLLS